jgi:transcriptional regulator with XRE-family HTH domain
LVGVIAGVEVARFEHESSQLGRRGTQPSALALLRFMRGLSQRELALRSGVSRRTVIGLEHYQHAPRVSTAVAITEALGLDDPRIVFPEAFDTENDERPGAENPGARETSAAGGPMRGS